ncbi:hypothetical protein QR685DRAFT_440801, partial [Neurospora intermedia]
LNNDLVKRFIRPSISKVTLFMLLIKKLSGSIKTYINYKSINNTFLNNRYLLLLTKETLNTIYKVK